ncbi:hypothetical protein HYR82_01170 [Candidatus Peregrinibacteria bacterium]|nr:hypothetical protein [Candidatus Peregrinibacteria bacterium]
MNDMQTIRRRIQQLGKKRTFIKFRRATGHETLEELERRKAETQYVRALCQRIWWNLSAKERTFIRTKILAANPSYRKNPENYFLQHECIEEVKRYLLGPQYTVAK